MTSKFIKNDSDVSIIALGLSLLKLSISLFTSSTVYPYGQLDDWTHFGATALSKQSLDTLSSLI